MCVHAYKKLLFIWYIRKSNRSISLRVYMHTKNSCLSDIFGKQQSISLRVYKKLLFILYIRKSNIPYPYVCTRIQKTLVYLIYFESNGPYPCVYTHTKNSCSSDILGKATVHILTCVQKTLGLSDILGKATVHILMCVHAYKKRLFTWYIRESNSPYPYAKNSCLSDILGKAIIPYPYMCTHIQKNSCLSDILGKATVHILTCVHAYKKLLFIWYIRKSNSPYPYVCTKNSCLSDILGKATVHILVCTYTHTKNACLPDILGKATVHILTCVHAYKNLLFIWYIRKSNGPYPYMCTKKNSCLSDILGKATVHILTCVQKTLVYLIY